MHLLTQMALNDFSYKILTNLIKEADAQTYDHSIHVANITAELVSHTSLQPNESLALVKGALIHDIGKIDIPVEILRKPDKLTEDEWNIIKTHPYKGYLLAKKFSVPNSNLSVIYNHHERADGSGYPNGICVTDLQTNLIIIADTWAAMTEHRPYSSPAPPSNVTAAIKEMYKNGKITKEAYEVYASCQKSKREKTGA